MNCYTDFGQIEIYNSYFVYDDNVTIHSTPLNCIYSRSSYTALINKIRVPIMIGSNLHIHKDENPLNIYGYFIIDGICKSLSLVYVLNNTLYSKDRAFLSIGKISIKSMGVYIKTINNKDTRWYLPGNYIDICKFSKHKDILLDHFNTIKEYETSVYKYNPSINLDNNDCIILCYMFENWLGLEDNVIVSRRLITPGELIHDNIKYKNDIVECFRTHKWSVKNMLKVNSLSEDMKHYSIIGDIESVRRITYPSVREYMQMSSRLVRDEELGLICPVQTSDGSLCGTILYLAKGARVTNTNVEYTIINNIDNTDDVSDNVVDDVMIIDVDDYIDDNIIIDISNNDINVDKKYLYIDGKYISMVDDVEISCKHNCYKNDKIILIWLNNGVIYNDTDDYLSITASYIPYYNHNPAVRSMFSCNMIKQALTVDDRLDIPFNDTKRLVNGSQPSKGNKFPVDYGWDLVTAIMPWYGFNVEDSIVISKSVSKKYISEKINCYYTKLNSNDKILEVYVNVGDSVTVNQILYKSYKPGELMTTDIVRSKHNGYVKSIINNIHCYTVVINKLRLLKIGDKMCSRHGQKGVVSLILDDKDMPEYYNGNEWIKLELLINPHAFPSRMTYGQLIEMGIDEYKVRIPSKNIIINNKIIVGKCYYMALRHQVDDKMQYVDNGDIDPISLQAISGKSKNGGLRFGSMERDILLSVGAHSTLQELYSIDITIAYSCNKCGNISVNGKDRLCNLDLLDKCEYTKFNCHQYLLICCGLLKGCNYELKYWYTSNKYIITNLDKSRCTSITNDFSFGDDDILDIRYYYNTPILPIQLRNSYLNNLYNRRSFNKIREEHTRLLFGKDGAYHKYTEGHKINHCLRSVIVPNPELDIDTIEIPFGSDIGREYGLLNRQPSLSYKSMMCVKIKLGDTDCIRFNPQLCESFNADFDGDEMCVFGIKNYEHRLPVRPSPIQDYILGDIKDITEDGLTANYNGIVRMVNSGSKGKPFNIKHIYEEIGDVYVNKVKIGTISSCYKKGLTKEEWYMQAKAGREAASTIGIHTPYIGGLNYKCNNLTI